MKNITFKHLTKDDRIKIEVWLMEGYSQTSIASKLTVNRSTISREIHDRSTPTGYHAHIAVLNYQKKRQVCHPINKIEATIVSSYAIGAIRAGWSPETISGRIKREIDQGKRPKSDYLCPETIYQFIYQSEFGKREQLYQYLRRGKKHRTRKFGRKSQKETIPNRVFIDFRPKEANLRQGIGHWEGDTIHYAKKQGINSLVERKARYLELTKLMRRTAVETQRAVEAKLRKHIRKTLTVDNGSENASHQEIADSLNLSVFFCHPYHSWEKGSNENANGLVRRYLPKRSSLDDVSQQDLDDIAEELNNRPRKVLDFQTPKEVLEYEYQKLTNVAVRVRV